MYDTIHTYLPKDVIGISNIDDALCSLLKNVNRTEYENGGYSISGTHHNLSVKASATSVKIQGSISKYHLNDNQNSLSRGDMQRAIERLSDELYIPVHNGHLTRIDIAHNMVVKHDPLIYLKYLGDLQYFDRLEQPNGLYYNGTNKQHLFYNKLKEQKLRGIAISPLLTIANILRFETRLSQRIPKFLNTSKALVQDLYNEETYIKLSEYWKDEYFRINKINKLMSNLHLTGSTKQMLEVSFLMLSELIGQDVFHKLIKESQELGKLDKKQVYDLRKKIKTINNSKKIADKNDLINELDKRINESVMYYR